MELKSKTITPILLGLSGPALTAAERELIQKIQPLGFLLFTRNIQTPKQARSLCAELAALSSVSPPLIAVDQEGGRVQRLTFDGRLPPAQAYGVWYQDDPVTALEACRLGYQLLAAQLSAVGANWLLGPVLDVAHPLTHEIIGDRAFAEDPAAVAALGQAALEGIHAGGCVPCIKHAPGHGRAVADSHHELPVVAASKAELERDALPFKQLASHSPFMMTAHIRYPAWDDNPATLSPLILEDMRKAWKFKGLILADDVGMNALCGSYAQRAQAALEAGCDVVICSLSRLREGMAGTVYHTKNAAELASAALPFLTTQASRALEKIKMPPAPSREMVAEARVKLKALWADAPAGLGYTLAL